MDFKEWYEEHRNNGNWPKKLKARDLVLYAAVDAANGIRWSEKAFCFLQKLTETPKCECGVSVKWYGRIYSKYCSPKCASAATASVRSAVLKNKSEDEKRLIAQKNRETSIRNGGVDCFKDRIKKISKEAILAREASRKAAMIDKYGVDNVSKIERFAEKRKQTIGERTDIQREQTRIKTLNTRISRGRSYKYDDPHFFKSKKNYTRRVRYITNKNIKKHSLFKDRSKEMHVDHQISISFAYSQKIPPEIIAHPCNLRLLSAFENVSKGGCCSLLIDDLYKLIADSDIALY